MAAEFCALNAREIPLSVDLASKGLVPLLAAWVAVAGNVAEPAAILAPLDAAHELVLSARFRARYALTRAAVAHFGEQYVTPVRRE